MKAGRRVRCRCCLSPILFKLYSEYLTNEAREGFGDLKIGGHGICTVKSKVMGPSRAPSNCLCSMITNDARYRHKYNPGFPWQKQNSTERRLPSRTNQF